MKIKKYALNSRLQIYDICFFSIHGIDIVEGIIDNRQIYPSSGTIGVFNLCSGYGSCTFSLTFGRFAISSSPFINAQGNNIFGKVCLNYSHFSKNTFANKDEIVIIGT